MTANPAQDMDEMAAYASMYADRVPQAEPIPVGEVIHAPPEVLYRRWREAGGQP